MSIIEMLDFPSIKEGKDKNCIRCQHCLAICPTAALSILGKNPDESISCKGELPTLDEMTRLIKTRRSARKFKKGNVDRQLIDSLLDTALHAPTGHNTNSVHFHVVDNKESLDKFREIFYKTVLDHQENGTMPDKYAYIANFAKLWFKNGVDVVFRDAPHMLISSAPESVSSPVVDSLIAMTYFELLANTSGIGILWNGMINWALQFVAPELKKLINIPDNHVIGYVQLFGISSTKYSRGIQSDGVHINNVSL